MHTADAQRWQEQAGDTVTDGALRVPGAWPDVPRGQPVARTHGLLLGHGWGRQGLGTERSRPVSAASSLSTPK